MPRSRFQPPPVPLHADAPKAGGNGVPPLATSAPPQSAAPASTTASAANPPAPPPAAAPVPIPGLAVEIAGRALTGKNRFDIRLDPPELGRIEVRLDVGHDGRVTTHMIADRSDTLALLQRDASGLQRALHDAGLKTADNGLQFSLRDQSGGQQQPMRAGPAAPRAGDEETLAPLAPLPTALTRSIARANGIDIRV